MKLQLVNEWVKSAEGCFAAGDIASMRACGRQILEESPGNPVAMALIAEASVYMQDFQEAESWLEKMDQAVDKGSSQGWKLDNGNLRILFAKALYYGAQYELSLAMEAYEKLIDIVLDTAPYNGGLTTCDALYMGVPELIAENLREYTGKAVQLAKNGMLLNRLHRELPEQVRNSRLMDGKGYMQELEEAYRQIWGLYCQQG